MPLAVLCERHFFGSLKHTCRFLQKSQNQTCAEQKNQSPDRQRNDADDKPCNAESARIAVFLAMDIPTALKTTATTETMQKYMPSHSESNDTTNPAMQSPCPTLLRGFSPLFWTGTPQCGQIAARLSISLPQLLQNIFYLLSVVYIDNSHNYDYYQANEAIIK